MSNYSGLYAAGSGAVVQNKRLEIITNNLANMNTVGFKKDVISFRSLLTQAEKSSGMTALVALSESRTDLAQGSLRETGNSLDLALKGEGFFEVMTDQGVRYTRKGQFVLDGAQQLVTLSGDTVSGEGGPLILDGANISVGEDGEVSVDNAVVGKIKVVGFEDAHKLEKESGNLFRNVGGDENLVEDSSTGVSQGYLEYSNVNQVQDMVKLIEISRAYESYQKVILSIDESTQKLVNESGL